MITYRNLDGDSGVRAYQIIPDGIIVRFTTGSTYEYTYQSAGSANIERMITYAVNGSGLNGFIISNVKYKYSRKY